MPFNPTNVDSELIMSTRMVSGLKKSKKHLENGAMEEMSYISSPYILALTGGEE